MTEKMGKRVSFEKVTIAYFPMGLSENPSVSSGVAAWAIWRLSWIRAC